MKTLINSSFIYACLVLIFTLSVFINETFLNAQAQDLEIVHLNQSNESLQSNQFNLEQTEATSDEQQIPFSQALSLSRQGETEQAIKLYQEIIVQQPNHQMAAINLVILLKKTQGCEQLEASMLHAINVSRGKRKAKAHSLFASCLNEQKQYSKALHHLDKSLEFRPNHAATWLKRALIQQKAQLPFSQVLQSYGQALAMDEKNQKIRIDMAIYQQAHLDFNGSIKTLKDKYKSLKSSVHANQILAWNYLEIGKINNAKKHANLAHSLQSSDNTFNQALIDFLEGNTAQALENASQLKKNAEHHYLLAKIYQKKKWFKHSNTQLKKIITTQGDSHYDLRVAWMTLNNLKPNTDENSHLQALKEFLNKDIAPSYVAYEASKQAKDLNRFTEAKAFIELARTNTTAKNYSKNNEKLYGEILWLNNQKPQAVSHLTALSLKHPTNRSIKRLLGKYLINQQQLSKALAVLTTINEPQRNKKDLFTLASLHSQLNQPIQAIEHLTELLQRDERHIEARFLLAQQLLKTDQVKMGKKHLALLLKLDQHHLAAQKLFSQVI